MLALFSIVYILLIFHSRELEMKNILSYSMAFNAAYLLSASVATRCQYNVYLKSLIKSH